MKSFGRTLKVIALAIGVATLSACASMMRAMRKRRLA